MAAIPSQQTDTPYGVLRYAYLAVCLVEPGPDHAPPPTWYDDSRREGRAPGGPAAGPLQAKISEASSTPWTKMEFEAKSTNIPDFTSQRRLTIILSPNLEAANAFFLLIPRTARLRL